MNDLKLREKLAEIIHAPRCGCAGECAQVDTEIAQAILQSPDLQVTLLVPRHSVERRWDQEKDAYRLCVTDNGTPIASFYPDDPIRAREYCEWLNSKEPK